MPSRCVTTRRSATPLTIGKRHVLALKERKYSRRGRQKHFYYANMRRLMRAYARPHRDVSDYLIGLAFDAIRHCRARRRSRRATPFTRGPRKMRPRLNAA